MRSWTLLAASIAATLSVAHAAEIEKIVLPAGVSAPNGYEQIADYGTYSVYRGNPSVMPQSVRGAYVLAEADILFFDRMHLNTQQSSWVAPTGFSLKAPTGAALQVVQFVGPLKDEWLEAVRATGAVPVHYIESNGYLVWADGAARSALASLAQEKKVLQFSEALPSFVKLGESLFERTQRNADGNAQLSVTVQLYRHGNVESTKKRLAQLGAKVDGEWTSLLGYENAKFTASLDQVRQIIELPDVFWVGEVHPRTLNDEVQAQVIRGYLNAARTGPQSEGYLPWLDAIGFPSTPSAYPIVDITDDGIGNRTVNSGDPTLHELGSASNPSRLVYNQTCGSASLNGTVGGHGHINANIALGYDLRANAATPGARFPGEYQRGLGMNPYGRISGTRVFNSSGSFDQSACSNSDTGVIRASYVAGARISSNSWGCAGCRATYDDSSQAYDVGTRDADLTTPGNQELITIFSAGNSGSTAATIGTPGNGKNMITVGASENQRPTDENGNWTDGCGVGPTGADNVMDVIGFSSRGPAPGQRVKPEVIAPGTHITGTRANPTTGTSTCDSARPVGNATYNASSGTSHSAPAVSGVASLAYWWIENGRGALSFANGSPSAPSPALMKAWMMAHPTYLTGVSANDTLPSNVQGYGMPNLESMFGETPTYVVNQTHTFAASGDVYEWTGAVADVNKPLRIALAYTDAAGAIGTSPQVNNLDLEVDVGSTTYLGNRFTGQWSTTGGTPDSRNNYEAVFLPSGTDGAITIRVKAFNIGGDGVPGNADTTDQDFALVCSNCVQEPTFVMVAEPTEATVCTTKTDQVPFNITLNPVIGFSTPVTLSAGGNPAGTTATFSVNPVNLPGISTFILGNISAVSAGQHIFTLTGTAGAEVKTRELTLTAFTGAPGSFDLDLPANGANNVELTPTLSWGAPSQFEGFTVEVATDAAFSNIVYSASASGASHVVGSELASNTRYFWRIVARNTCGTTGSSAVFSFTTKPLPGDCPAETEAYEVYATDFESGSAGWATSGTGTSNWAISSARARSGTQSILAKDLPTASDQRLDSPSIDLPTGELPLSLLFWNHQTIEDQSATGCYDGALLQISTDNGVTWTQVNDDEILVGKYNGPIATGFSNPAAGLRAWCGDPQDWTRYIVDLSSYAGQSVKLRFRMATDSSAGRDPDGFYLDDVKVQSCRATAGPVDLIFADGFEGTPE
jgi:hypothetical protein